MIASLQKELVDRAEELHSKRIETIYFGGGTPSLLTAGELHQFSEIFKRKFQIQDHVEWTLEVNPDDITIDNLRQWKKTGINRLSVGIQSFRQEDLNWMNRAHSAEESLNCLKLAKEAGFKSLSIDLIYGLPNMSNEAWMEQIETALSFNVEHFSAYCLTVEPNTQLNQSVQKGELSPANEDRQAEQFGLLRNRLKTDGYEQYEISNFALPKRHSRHNSNYWKGKPYIGIGPSAHSFDFVTRRFNVANNHKYMDGVESDKSYFEVEQLSTADQFNELLLTGLRTKWGVDVHRLESFEEKNEAFDRRVEQFIESGTLVIQEGKMCLTESGFLIADYVASELFSA